MNIPAHTGTAHVKRLADWIADDTICLPETVRDLARLHLEQIDHLGAHVAALDKRMRAEALRSETARRLQTAPGVEPVTAVAIETFAPTFMAPTISSLRISRWPTRWRA